MLNIERINKDLRIFYEFNYSIFLLKITRGRKEKNTCNLTYVQIKKKEVCQMATNKQIEDAWNNAHKIRGKNPDVYRKDDYGNIMYKSSYGKQSEMGWEVDHRHPKSKGGTESPRNLQAVQWEENRLKSDKYPYKN